MFSQVSALMMATPGIDNRGHPCPVIARVIIRVMPTARPGRPDPDGRHDDLTAADLDGLWQCVPDDARDLDADRAAWLREPDSTSPTISRPEIVVQPDPPTALRSSTSRRRRRLTITAVILTLSFLVPVVAGAIGGFLASNADSDTSAAPLAEVPASPGQIGGLLPQATLVRDGVPVQSQSIRPAVVVLIPPACADCIESLRALRQQAAEFDLNVTIIGTDAQAEQLVTLDRALGSVAVDVLIDRDGAFAGTYGSTDLNVLLVRDDGVLADILRNPPTDLRLEPALIGLFAPGSSNESTI